MEKTNLEEFDLMVDKFLSHKMSIEEERIFKQLLSQSDELRQRAGTIALMVKEMRNVQSEKEAKIVKTIQGMSESQFRKTIGLKAKIIPLKIQFLKYAIAACFIGIVTFCGYRYNVYQNTVHLGDDSYMAYVLDISMTEHLRGTYDSVIKEELNNLFYNVRDSKELKTSILELEKRYNLSLSPNSDYAEYIDDIAWNLSIAYLKVGNSEKPVPILEAMLERNKEYPEIVKPVQELIDRIYRL